MSAPRDPKNRGTLLRVLLGATGVAALLGLAMGALLLVGRELDSDTPAPRRPGGRVGATAGRPRPLALESAGGSEAATAPVGSVQVVAHEVPDPQAPLVGLRGQVVEKATGRPVPLATILLARSRARLETDAEGRFAVAAEAGAVIDFRVLATGYRGVASRGVAVDPAPSPGLIIELESVPIGRLEGIVSFPGEPRERVNIFLGSARHPQILEHGRFVFERLNVGSYRIGVAPLESVPQVWQRVEIKADETCRVELEMPDYARISGRLSTPDGPASLALIGLGKVIVPCDRDGRFDFPRLMPGTWTLRAWHPEYGPRDFGTIRVGPGEHRAGLDHVFEPEGQAGIRVEVLIDQADAPPTPATGRVLQVFTATEPPRPVRRAETDGRGTAEFRFLAPGTYRVAVTTKAGLVWHELSLRGREQGRVQLELPAEELAGGASAGDSAPTGG